ncbi:MAG: ASKHA domain-containing protein [Deferrisomatales bacterium]
MPTITVLPWDKRVEARPGETLLAALQRAGVDIESPCNGQGICGRCGVWVSDPHRVPETPHRTIGADQAAQGLRLACRVTAEGDLEVVLPEGAALNARILEGEKISGVVLAPAVRVQAEGGRFLLRYEDGPAEPLEGWEDGWVPKGLAVDIGTTTLVVSLFSLATGEELATASCLNPQTRFGHDVLSRIQKGSTPEGLRELAEAVRGGIGRLVEETCAASGSDPREVLDAVLGGNTTMLQLAAEIDPAPLGRLPFAVGLESDRVYPASRFGLRLHPRARVYVPPVAHAFVGSDITAGLLSCPGFFDGDRPLLFVDIGTNGEMALSSGGQWLVTSTAAGPAFEAMGLSSGMRAATGAVEAVSTDGETLEVRTVDGVPPKGICGSGILDLVAVLLELEVIDPTGRMREPGETQGLPPAVAERLTLFEGQPAFRLGEGVTFTQQDVRQIQLAKGAIRTGIDMLLSETGVPLEGLEAVVLAGAFGYHLRPKSLETIGLLPPGAGSKVTFAGNTSRTGCAQMLLDASSRRALGERMGRVRHVSLAEGLEFQERFVENLAFPER